jgi:hypothetical protein
MNRVTRRHFLAALGVAGVWLGGDSPGYADGALPSWLSSPSPPSSVPRPLRFVSVFTPHGRAHELWQPRPGFDIAYDGASLAPFDDPARYGQSFKDRLLVIDGIDLTAGMEVGTTGHDGARVILTGSGADGKNASLDQFLAVERGLGADTPHTSLVLGVGNDSSDVGANVSWARGGTPVPKWIDPSRVYAELFGEPLGARQEELDQGRRLGKSVLDRVRADLGRLGARAPASERVKLEQHATALREIEKRLAHVERACARPAAPPTFPRLKAYGGGEPYFDAITDLQVDLLARALCCDLTRFATLYLADLTRSSLVPELPEDIHSDVAHRYDARTGTHPGTPESWSKLALQNRYSYGKVARLLQRLAEGGALDTTLVHVSSDMGDPARHSSRHVPTLLAGGSAVKLRFGRYLDLRSSDGKQDGVPNNRLLISISQLFGAPTDRFGHAQDPAVVAGSLDKLRG